MNPGETLELGRHAAFHGAPVVGIAPLQALLATDAEPELREEAQWLLAVCQGATGLFGSALATVAALPAGSRFAARGHLVAGSVHRQLGLFDLAHRDDVLAAASPTPSVVCEALIGLAADAVGGGDPDAAAEHLDQAKDAWQPSWWREGVRLQWVNAELALLAGDASRALPGLHAAIDAAVRRDAPRHLAKTRGFLAVTIRSARPDDPAVCAQAMALLAQATDAAQTLAAWPLVWAFARLRWHWLRDQLGEGPQAQQARAQATRAVSLIAADLPEPMRPAFRRRPDVADLLADSA